MKPSTSTCIARGARLLAPSLAAALLLIGSGCVAQRNYDDAVGLSRHYQTQLHEREQYIAKLETERDQLKRALAMNDVSALAEAGYGDIDSRLSALQRKIDGLGRPLHDVERFDVEGGYVLMVQDKILFDSGSADLSPEGQTALARIATEIGQQPHGRIWVRGHSDSDRVVKPATLQKFPHGNLQLSAARAIEVAMALTATGRVDARDVAVAGFGPHDPIRPNDGAENKRLNRRVEIFVADRQAAAGVRPAAAGK